MTKYLTSALAALFFFAGSVSTSRAEVKSIRMKIAGYLCGN